MKKNFLKIRKSVFKKFNLQVVPIEKISLKTQFPESTTTERKILKICDKFSMTGFERLFSLIKSIHHVNNNRVPGDYVECGVWKGGNLILFQKMIQYLKIKDKKIFGFDTFEGMSNPTNIDKFLDGIKAKDYLKNQKKHKNIDNAHAFSPIDDVKKNYQKNTSKNKNLVLIKGKVEDTLKIRKNLPKKISILRLDTDFYESTKIELEILYPRLSKNGILIIDDYGEWAGARKATDEFFYTKKATFFKVDRACRIMFKK